MLTPEVLNATVDYWFKAMEHQNALRLLTDWTLKGVEEAKRKFSSTGMDCRDMLGLIHQDIGEIYPTISTVSKPEVVKVPILL